MPSNLNPQLAQLIAENASASSTAGTLTGEPCRCPESVLDCLCGAYTTKDNL